MADNEISLTLFTSDPERKNALIAKQALRISELERENKDMRLCIKKVFSYLYETGGPLNDDKLGFSKEQKKMFSNISDTLFDVIAVIEEQDSFLP
jgi:hypothetical protein